MAKLDPSRQPPDTTRPGNSFVADGLRDAGAVFSGPLFWLVNGAAILVIGLAGPFGTFEYLTFPQRLAYWSAAILAPALLTSTLSMIAFRIGRASGLHWSLGATVAGLLTVPPLLALVTVMEVQLQPSGTKTLASRVLELLPYVAIPAIGVALIVNALFFRFNALRDAVTEASQPEPAQAPVLRLVTPDDVRLPLLFQRIPEHLGRDLVCVRAQDHYLEVTTPLGSALVLMRLCDAERDLSGVRGLRVHRSWWVALDHVAGFSRAEAGGVSLTTSTGHMIPVSRGQRDALIAALADRTNAAE